MVDVAKGSSCRPWSYVTGPLPREDRPGPETLIVGDEAWMDVDGRLMKMPIPVGRIIASTATGPGGPSTP